MDSKEIKSTSQNFSVHINKIKENFHKVKS